MDIIPCRGVFCWLLGMAQTQNVVNTQLVNTQLVNTLGISQTSAQGLLQMLQILSYVTEMG